MKQVLFSDIPEDSCETAVPFRHHAPYMEGDRFFTDSVALNLSGNTIAEKIVDFFRYYTRLNLNTGLELMKILFQSDNKFFSRYRPMQKVLEDIVQGGLESGELKTEMTSREVVDFFFVLARGCC